MRSAGPAAELEWMGDRALRVRLGDRDDDTTHAAVIAARRSLAAAGISGIADLIPSYATLLVTLDDSEPDPDALEAAVRRALASPAPADAASAPRTVEIPVCYDAPCAPDLDDLARHAGLTRDEAVQLHAAAAYVVRFVGFTPGFPYLAGLPQRLAMPRLATPRTRVPAGSVGIADAQCGVYPAATPGGWRLIGQTRVNLFDPGRSPPALLSIGDRVRFVPVTRAAIDEPGGG